MKINPVSHQQNPSFGRVLLGRGGAKRLAETMSISDAKTLIGKDFLGKSDVLISENAVEVISPDRDRIFRVSNVVARGKDFTDIEVFEHGKRNIFKLKNSVGLNVYGVKNEQINLALAMAKEINANYKWSENFRFGENDDTLTDIKQKTIYDLEHYYKNYGMF